MATTKHKFIYSVEAFGRPFKYHNFWIVIAESEEDAKETTGCHCPNILEVSKIGVVTADVAHLYDTNIILMGRE